MEIIDKPKVLINKSPLEFYVDEKFDSPSG